MGKLLLAALNLALLGAACATTARGTRAEARAAADGRTLYEQSCQRCHALYMPSSFPADEWRFFVRKYGRKARLSPEEQAKVYEYLKANSGA